MHSIKYVMTEMTELQKYVVFVKISTPLNIRHFKFLQKSLKYIKF